MDGILPLITVASWKENQNGTCRFDREPTCAKGPILSNFRTWDNIALPAWAPTELLIYELSCPHFSNCSNSATAAHDTTMLVWSRTSPSSMGKESEIEDLSLGRGKERAHC